MANEMQVNSEPVYFLGIDGGGTKTQALVGLRVGEKLEIVGAGQGGASNPRAVGFDQAFINIASATHAAFATAGIPPKACSYAVLCLAGAGREQEKLAVETWALRSGLAKQVRLVSEAEAVLAATCVAQARDETRDGTTAEIALISGTGSLAWGRLTGTNAIARSGGWGYLLGDEGSGFWLGQQLLQIACHAADKRVEDPRVLDAVLGHLALASAKDLVEWCYGQAGSRERIAAIAPLVFTLQRVQSVSEVIASGSMALAQMIAAVTRQLGCSRYELAVAGSVMLYQQDYRQQVFANLHILGLDPYQNHCVDQPVRGALQLAANQSIS